ncbi:MAG: hypothetical protein ACLFSF_07365 [Desulfonatronovibrio sp.]
MLLGFTAYLSFGHAAFFGTAAYTTGLMLKHFSADIFPALMVSVEVLLAMSTWPYNLKAQGAIPWAAQNAKNSSEQPTSASMMR